MTTAYGFSKARWPAETHTHATMRLADLQQPSLKKRAVRFVIAFGMGLTTSLACQSYGNEIRAMIADSSPQLGWVAPQAALAETAHAAPMTTSATASPETQRLEQLVSVSLVAMQQSIDQLTAQFVASQQQMSSENAKMKQDILAKLNSPRPVAAPARKPAPVAPPPSLQELPER